MEKEPLNDMQGHHDKREMENLEIMETAETGFLKDQSVRRGLIGWISEKVKNSM